MVPILRPWLLVLAVTWLTATAAAQPAEPPRSTDVWDGSLDRPDDVMGIAEVATGLYPYNVLPNGYARGESFQYENTDTLAPEFVIGLGLRNRWFYLLGGVYVQVPLAPSDDQVAKISLPWPNTQTRTVAATPYPGLSATVGVYLPGSLGWDPLKVYQSLGLRADTNFHGFSLRPFYQLDLPIAKVVYVWFRGGWSFPTDQYERYLTFSDTPPYVYDGGQDFQTVPALGPYFAVGFTLPWNLTTPLVYNDPAAIDLFGRNR